MFEMLFSKWLISFTIEAQTDGEEFNQGKAKLADAGLPAVRPGIS